MLSLTSDIKVDAWVVADRIHRAPVVVVEGALVHPPPALDKGHRRHKSCLCIVTFLWPNQDCELKSYVDGLIIRRLDY